MPDLKDIQSLRKVRDENLAFLDSQQEEYNRLNAEDPLAARKFSAQFKERRDYIKELDAEVQQIKGRIANDLATGAYLTKGMSSSAPLEFDKEGNPIISEDLGAYLKKPFRPDEGYFKSASEDYLSAYMGEKVVLDEGMSGGDRIGLGFFSPKKRSQLMDKWYPEKHEVKNVAGKRFNLYKDGDTWKPINPIGFQWADLAMLPAEIVPTAGAIVGAGAGTAATGGPWGGAMGASLGYAAAGTAQDQFAAKIAGITDAPWHEDLGRRSLEGMVGILPDRGMTALGGRLIASKTARKNSLRTFRDDVIEQEDWLRQNDGVRLRASTLVDGGADQNLRRVKVAERRRGTEIAKDYDQVVSRAERFMEDSPKLKRSEGLYRDGIESLKASARQTKDMVGLYNGRAAKIMDAAHRREMEKLVPNYKFGARDSIGERMNTVRAEVLGNAEKAKNKIYEESFYPASREAGFSADPIAVAKAAERDYFSEATRTPEVDKLLRELRDRPKNAEKIVKLEQQLQKGGLKQSKVDDINYEIGELRKRSGNLDAKELHSYVRRFREAHPLELAGSSESKLAAARASRGVAGIRDQMFKEKGLDSLWRDASSRQEMYMSLQEGKLGGVMKEVFGESPMTNTEMTQKVISDPEISRKVLGAVREHAPDAYEENLNLMREAYLRKIGIQQNQGMLPSELTHDTEMLLALWGRDQFDQPTTGAALRMGKILDGLNADFKTYKLDPAKIGIDDLEKLKGAYNEADFDIIKKNIVGREKNIKEAKEIQSSALLKIAKKGHREAIQSHEFPAAMWKSNSDELKKIFGQFSTADQEVMRGDFMEFFFANYPPTGEYGKYGKSLWNGERFLKDIKKSPQIAENLRTVVGDEQYRRMVAYSTVIQTTKRAPKGVGGTPGGGTLNEGGPKLYASVRPAVDYFGDMWVAAAYRAKVLPFQTSRVKDVTPEAYREAYTKAIRGLINTSEGIQALTLTGRHDPNWGAHLGTIIGEDPETPPEQGLERRYK